MRTKIQHSSYGLMGNGGYIVNAMVMSRWYMESQIMEYLYFDGRYPIDRLLRCYGWMVDEEQKTKEQLNFGWQHWDKQIVDWLYLYSVWVIDRQ